jgi:hypothetical protein
MIWVYTYLGVCKHDEFRCETDDVCIPKSHRCDYMEQCDDGTDEDDCGRSNTIKLTESVSRCAVAM